MLVVVVVVVVLWYYYNHHTVATKVFTQTLTHYLANIITSLIWQHLTRWYGVWVNKYFLLCFKPRSIITHYESSEEIMELLTD